MLTSKIFARLIEIYRRQGKRDIKGHWSFLWSDRCGKPECAGKALTWNLGFLSLVRHMIFSGSLKHPAVIFHTCEGWALSRRSSERPALLERSVFVSSLHPARSGCPRVYRPSDPSSWTVDFTPRSRPLTTLRSTQSCKAAPGSFLAAPGKCGLGSYDAWLKMLKAEGSQRKKPSIATADQGCPCASARLLRKVSTLRTGQ